MQLASLALVAQLALLAPLIFAVSVPFKNCLDPVTAQTSVFFLPLGYNVSYNKDNDNLSFLIPGNVSGVIQNVENGFQSSLEIETRLLDYSVIPATFVPLCSYSSASCPLEGYTVLHFMHDLSSSYQLVSLITQFRIVNPSGYVVGCVQAEFTPTFSSDVSHVFTYVVLALAIMMIIAVVLAAMLNPWSGSSDPLIWSSMFNFEPEAIRLVTPGLTDLLQYVQFAIFSASLSIHYPTFFQPIMVCITWVTGLINTPFSSHHNSISEQDNIYVIDQNAYGLSRLRSLVGLGSDADVWASFAVYTAVVLAALLVIVQIGFLIRHLYFRMFPGNITDLRHKYIPTMLGMCTRTFCNLFALPLVTYCCFAFLVAPTSPRVITAFAAIFLILYFCIWAVIFYKLYTTHPKQELYTDLQVVLAIGPVFNTLTPRRAASFNLVLFSATLARGIVFGGAQKSGIAQIAVLAVVEVLYCASIYFLRPYDRITNMNTYYTAISIARFCVIMLSIGFVSDDVAPYIKSWIGYAILLVHGIVLLFVFALQIIFTLVEIILRTIGTLSKNEMTPFAYGFARFKPRDPDQTTHKKTLANSPKSSSSEERTHLPFSHNTASFSTSGSIDANGGSPSISQADNYSRDMAAAAAAGIAAGAVGSHSVFYRQPRRSTVTRTRDASFFETPMEGSDDDFEYQHTPSPRAPLSRSSSNSKPPSIIDESESRDYAVREADVYYRRSREPLSAANRTRKFVTGPANPTSISTNVKNWIGRHIPRKANQKGFEVVRSKPVRAPVFNEDPEDVPDDAASSAPTTFGLVPNAGSKRSSLATGSNDISREEHTPRGRAKFASLLDTHAIETNSISGSVLSGAKSPSRLSFYRQGSGSISKEDAPLPTPPLIPTRAYDIGGNRSRSSSRAKGYANSEGIYKDTPTEARPTGRDDADYFGPFSFEARHSISSIPEPSGVQFTGADMAPVERTVSEDQIRITFAHETGNTHNIGLGLGQIESGSVSVHDVNDGVAESHGIVEPGSPQ
ncbi:hypothetical protein CANCADRAFT_31220 [Tortispora caseinolytica NRRL Y-17796]|uniref:ML-like domain-containing protein n=1 Tax=Tortispora caseinolytica NRRL Y-17796 TaxID=767744 RepID=A0A1E4TEI2_9ASCO|nr:hypothetical protein CANCADRAFT_31220 [Tortispora caseinolytica NRRL Y-17796]